MRKKIILPVLLLSMFSLYSFAQDKPPAFSISGVMGVSYEGYGLSRSPSGWMGYTPRKPWNQVRFNFTPTMKFGANWSIPFNLNFSTTPTNFAGPYSGIIK